VRHARVHDQLASDPQYAGGIGWCAFDYNTHGNFGSGDRICYHGVTDIFREPKPAAGFYRSQCDPGEEIVLVPAFHWARGDESIGFTDALVSSNCDHLKFYVADKLVAEADPDRAHFPHLKYAPFTAEIGRRTSTPGAICASRDTSRASRSSRAVSRARASIRNFHFCPTTERLIADGADTTRVVLRVTDEFDAIRPFAADAIRFELAGPAQLIGDNPFSLVGGTGAIWIRATEQPGKVRLTAHHPYLGAKSIEFEFT
jgi:beta-galactosidase